MKSVRTLIGLVCAFGLLMPGLVAAQTDCPNPVAMNCGDTASGDTTNMTNNLEVYAPCIGWALASPEAYFTFTLDTQSVVSVLLEPDNWDPALIILPDDGGECTTPPLGCADEIGTMDETVTVSLPAGTYYVVVDGYGGDVGPFDLTVDCCDDVDGDGFGGGACSDCCDVGDEGTPGCDASTASRIYPGAPDWCTDGIDHDCDGLDCCPDVDGDGYASVACGGFDCCDDGTEDSPGCSVQTAVDINGGAKETCGNATDENCDGFFEETCPTCAASATLDCANNNSGSASLEDGSDVITDYCVPTLDEGLICLGEFNNFQNKYEGPEYIFGYTAAVAGMVSFQMTNASDTFDLFLMDDYGTDDNCGPVNLLSWSWYSAQGNTVGVWADAGDSFFISVDGRSRATGTFDWALACLSETCSVGEAIECDASLSGDNTDAENNVTVYGAGGTGEGPELVYSFTAVADGELTATLAFDGDAIDLDFFILEDAGDGVCNPGNLIAASATANSEESVTFYVSTGVTYYLVADGWTASDYGPFTLTTSCVNCPVGETYCGWVDCVDTQTDLVHCGGCGLGCDLYGVDEHVCVDGVCEIITCDADFDDCNLIDADGCEADLMNDNANCGGCDIPCSDPTPVCISGECSVCPDGTTLCSGACVDLQTDEAHCGACDSPCDTGETCCAGGCVDMASDEANCGACGNVCAGGEECVEGLCCAAGLSNCGGVCVDLAGDPANCGTCGEVCDLTNVDEHGCVAGSCSIISCDAGYGDCDTDAASGCEVDTETNISHCGQCAEACDLANVAIQICVAGVCTVDTCADGYDDCDTDDATGCETEIGTIDDCGACDDACAAGQECVGGDCCTDGDDDGHYLPTDCAAGDDCDDEDASAYPTADEECDEVDNDCDGTTDEGFDADNDGYTSCGGDCDDASNLIYPGAQEVCGDDVDQDCNGSDLDCDCPDADNDGHQAEFCGGDDCNDNDGDIYTGNEEVCGDDKDNNCNDEVDEDCGGGDDGCGCSAAGGSPISSGLLIMLLVLGMAWLPSRRR